MNTTLHLTPEIVFFESEIGLLKIGVANHGRIENQGTEKFIICQMAETFGFKQIRDKNSIRVKAVKQLHLLVVTINSLKFINN